MPATLRSALNLEADMSISEVVLPLTAYTQTYATASRTVPAATALTPPAGGTGATAGAYDSAANRDLMIASITATQADLLALKQVVNSLINDLRTLKVVP